MERDPEDKADLIKYQIESAWNLSQWQVVEESCPQTTSTDWQTNLGKSLLLAKVRSLSDPFVYFSNSMKLLEKLRKYGHNNQT